MGEKGCWDADLLHNTSCEWVSIKVRYKFNGQQKEREGTSDV